MLNKLLNSRPTSFIIFLRQAATIQSNLNLGHEMKLLNDKNNLKTLELFDKYKENNIETFFSFIITQALKACSQIGDLRRGENIHRLISSHMKNDSYVLVSLIHLYSKFKQRNLSYFFIIKVQCGDVTYAQSLFNTSKIKSYQCMEQ
jgi:hypothetical protein